MSLSLEDIHRIAHLARIEISDAEADGVREKLAGIFGLIDEMQRVDTTGVEPMAHAEDVALPLRDDAVTEPDRHEHFQTGAPQTAHGLYLVPRVID